MALHAKPRKPSRPKHYKKSLKKGNKILNLPSVKLPIVPFTREELILDSKRRVSRVSKDLSDGFEFIRDHRKSVTFFGSASLGENDKYYKKAVKVAQMLSLEGYTIITGGGPGIMEAANRGGRSSEEGKSLGLTIKLPDEQVVNPYVTDFREFRYFFTRKVCLTFAAEAYLYFPGGFGTLDEFFEILTLVQTRKIEKVPIICVGSEFWEPFHQFIDKTLYYKFKTISKGDMYLYKVLDDEKEIVNIIKRARIRQQ